MLSDNPDDKNIRRRGTYINIANIGNSIFEVFWYYSGIQLLLKQNDQIQQNTQ